MVVGFVRNSEKFTVGRDIPMEVLDERSSWPGSARPTGDGARTGMGVLRQWEGDHCSMGSQRNCED